MEGETNEKETQEDGKEDQDARKEEEVENAAEVRGQWPDAVGYKEDDPKKGYVYIIMSIDDLNVDAPRLGKAKVLNADRVDEAKTFKSKEVDVKLNVKSDKGSSTLYQYKKSLPKEIDPLGSTVKFEKNGQVKVRMKKAKPELTWTQFKDYLTYPDEPEEQTK